MDIDKISEDFENVKKELTIDIDIDGEKGTTLKVPQTKEEAFYRFENIDVIEYFLELVDNFQETRLMTIKTLSDELTDINSFITKAEKIKFNEAVSKTTPKHDYFNFMGNEYVKFKTGYYIKKEFFSYFSFFDSHAKYVKSKYFLYKEWLESELNKISNPQFHDKYDFKITLKHIALKAHYEGKNISESNASEFLVGTGFKSGKKLSQLYAFYNNSTDRRADPEGKTKLKNKIKFFKEVTSLLPEDKRGKAIDETRILESFISLY